MSDELTGIQVLVTRPSHQADKLVRLIESHGGTALRFPTLQIEASKDTEAIAAQIGAIADYDIAIFVSINAVSHGAHYLPTSGKRPLLAAIGPSTARALKDSGFATDIKATRGFTSEALLRESQLQDVEGKKIIIFRGSGGRALLGRELEERGATVTYAEVYRRDRPDVLEPGIEQKLSAGSIDIVTATSAETLVNLYELAEEPSVTGLLGTQLVTSSERVVKKAAALGFKKEARLAAGPDDQALVNAILEWRAATHEPESGAGSTMTEPVAKEPAETNDTGDDPGVELVEETAATETETTAEEITDAPAAAPAKRSGGAVSLLAVLLSLAALTASAYLWWQQQQAADNSAASRSQTSGVISSTQQNIASLDERLEESLSRVSSLDASRNRLDSNIDDLRRNVEMLTSRVQGAEQSIDDVRGVSAAARTNWVRAEAEYYMQVANSRLQLAQDPDAALAALLAADDRLKALGDPSLYRVRQEIAGEIAALKAVPRPDIEGIAHTLNGLAARVDELPLHNASPDSYESSGETAIDAEGALDRAMATLGGVFTSMISVKRTEEAATPLLSRDEEFFLKRNLELQLHSARLALIGGDEANYIESLRTARNWLQTHFMADSAAVAGAISALTEAEAENISPPMPDISGSLRLLRITAPVLEATPAVEPPAEETEAGPTEDETDASAREPVQGGKTA